MSRSVKVRTDPKVPDQKLLGASKLDFHFQEEREAC